MDCFGHPFLKSLERCIVIMLYHREHLCSIMGTIKNPKYHHSLRDTPDHKHHIKLFHYVLHQTDLSQIGKEQLLFY